MANHTTTSLLHAPFRWLRQTWPLLLLLLLEGLAFAYLNALAPLPVTPFSLLVAGLIATLGVLLALVRPAAASTLAGCFAILLAAILVVPLDAYNDSIRPLDLPMPFWQQPSGIPLRLANVALLGPVALHLTTIFPQHRPIRRGALGCCYSISLALLLVALRRPQPQGRFLITILSAWVALLLVAAVIQLIRAGIERGPAHQRSAQQARLVLASVLLAEAPVLFRPMKLFLGQTWRPFDLGLLPYNLILGLQILLPLGIGYAIIRHDLFGIDSALRRALAYGALTLMVLVVYFGMTLLLNAVLTAVLPDFAGLATIGALLVAAALFEPLRSRAQRLVDRLLYPGRLHFQHELAAIGTRLSRVVSRGEVAALLASDLPQRIDAAWATLDLEPAEAAPVARAVAPDPAGFQAALVVGGNEIGRYALGPRRSGPAYSGDEIAQLRALAQQAALALAYAMVYDQLRALNSELEQRVDMRSALVLEQARALAVLEERQRLARELHDSVTQALFSISLSARALPRLLQRDQSAAMIALQEQERTAQLALAEMRDLLTQLRDAGVGRPAPNGDLVAALREHCAHMHRQAGMDVALDLPAASSLPATLAAALLRVAQEALHNTLKHSGTCQARLTLAIGAGAVALEIADSGRGFDQTGVPHNGSRFGLQGMGERVAEIGGTLTIDSTPGCGTTVRVQVPIT